MSIAYFVSAGQKLYKKRLNQPLTPSSLHRKFLPFLELPYAVNVAFVSTIKAIFMAFKLGKNLGNAINKIIINYDLYTIIFIKSYSTCFH